MDDYSPMLWMTSIHVGALSLSHVTLTLARGFPDVFFFSDYCLLPLLVTMATDTLTHHYLIVYTEHGSLHL